MELFHAHDQWAKRPADQRFTSLEEMLRQTKAYAEAATERDIPWRFLRAEASSGTDLHLVGKGGLPAKLTHHSFGQLAARVGAPPAYLRGLPATLAAQNLNHGLANRVSDAGNARVLFHENGELIVRALNTKRYERVWNHEVISRLIDLSHKVGLVPGQETFSWSERRPGEAGPDKLDPNAPKSLYASDHDMFAFLMQPDRVLVDPVGKEMRRGIIAGNSEVGGGSLWFMSFYFRDVCANHIIWGAEGVVEIRLPHVGNIRNKMLTAQMEIRRYLDRAESTDRAKMEALRVMIADDKDKVLDRLFSIRTLDLSRKALEASYEAVKPDEDGDPRTVWGIAQGITRQAQATEFADERHTLDRAAGRLLAMQF